MPDAADLDAHDDDAPVGIPPHADERRSTPRRADDLALGQLAWLEWIVLHRAKLGVVVATAASLVTLLATTMALRLIAEHDLVTLTRTVAEHDSSITALDHRMGTMEESQRFQNYLSCVLVRRVDPNALPPTCQSVITAQGTP